MSRFSSAVTSPTKSSKSSSPLPANSPSRMSPMSLNTARSQVHDMEVEYAWLKHELNSAVGTIKTEKVVNYELTTLLTSMEQQLANLQDRKMIDLGDLRSGNQDMISQTIMAKKVRMTTAITRLQEEIERTHRENQDIQSKKQTVESNLVQCEEKFANCTIDLMDVSNKLQSEILVHKMACRNYEDEIAYYYKLLSTSSNSITELCGNSTRYVAYYKKLRSTSPSSSYKAVKGISALASTIANSDFDLLEHKCQIIGFKALYKTLGGVYRYTMNRALRQWHIVTVAHRIREKLMTDAQSRYQMGLSELDLSLRNNHDDALSKLRAYFEAIIAEQKSSILRLEASREQAVLELYSTAGDNIFQSNLTHNKNIQRHKDQFEFGYFGKWLSMAYKQYLRKYRLASTEAEEYKRKLLELQQMYDTLNAEFLSNLAQYQQEAKCRQLCTVIICGSRSFHKYRIFQAFSEWKRSTVQWKHEQQLAVIVHEKEVLQEQYQWKCQNFDELSALYKALVTHCEYVETGNDCMSVRDQSLQNQLLIHVMFGRWKDHHYQCIIMKYKCKSDNYPNLRRLAQASLSKIEPIVSPVVLISPPKPPSPHVTPTKPVVISSPRESPKRTRPPRPLFIMNPVIVEEQPVMVTCHYKKYT